MNKFKNLYYSDCHRYGGRVPFYQKRFLYWFRKSQTSSGLFKFLNIFVFRLIASKRGIEISFQTKIDSGLYIGHPYNITINPKTEIGKNCNIHKGVLIGQENRGKREGVPKIGDNVWIGINSVIVGKVTIGSDVLIAPNCYVNCDIPDHSIAFGNPCQIRHKDSATEKYINNIVE